MSREIKFRAWDGEQYYYDIMPSPIPSRTLDVCKEITNYEPEYSNMVQIIEGVENIEQYTGLKDKNGEEIYEGDIVRYGDQVYEVKFDEMKDSDCSYYYLGWAMGDLSLCEHNTMAEVIGNIHENPELLEN